MRITHTTEVRASVDRLWDLTVDVEGWPALSPTMTSIERLDEGPIAPGSTARVVQPRQRARTWTVSEVEPGRRFVWHTRALGCTMTGEHRLEPRGDTCTQTLGLELTGGPAPLVGRLLGRTVRQALAQENAGFARAAETAESTGSTGS